MSRINTKPLSITVPIGFANEDGNPQLHVKVKTQKKAGKVIMPHARPTMEVLPEYSDLYRQCYDEMSVKFAGQGQRKIGYEALKLSQARIAADQQAKQKKVSEAVAVEGNSLEDWESAFLAKTPEAVESVDSADEGWMPADEETMTMLMEAAARPSQPYKPKPPKVIEMRRQEPAKTAATPGWNDGFVKKAAKQTPAQTRIEPEDFLNVPGLGSQPSDVFFYASLDTPYGELQFRFNWLLRDDAADRWVIFVQDTRNPELTDIRQYLDQLEEGPGDLRISDDPEVLDKMESIAVNTLANCFTFGDLVFVQFFLTK